MPKVVVTPKLFDKMEQEWAPPDDPVFRLVPPTFAEQATALYAAMGQPAVSSLTFWVVYVDLLAAFRALPSNPQMAEALLRADEGGEEDMELLPGLRELWNGDNVIGQHGYLYYGGLENPPPMDHTSASGEDEDEEAGLGNIDLREYADSSD